MHIREKVLYNLLRLNWLKDPSLAVIPWQVADYRALGDEEIFEKLKLHGITMDEDRFIAYADEVDSPEELASLVWTGSDEDIASQDQAYLLLFELWRRLLPEKETLSLFCDELDHQIHLFLEQGKIEEIDEMLVRLEDILDSYADQGEDPEQTFQAISSSCAYDLEGFLQEYILELIGADEEMFASELLDGFDEYVLDKKRFEFLRIRLFAQADPLETVRLLTELVDSLIKETDFPLLLEIAGFLVCFGQDPLYRKVIQMGLLWMQTEEEFCDILKNLQDYFCCLDQENKQHQVEQILSRRANISPDSPVDPKDSAIALVKKEMLF